MVEIQPVLRDKPRLMGMIERVNDVIRSEFGPRHRDLRVHWRLDRRSGRPPGLHLEITDSVLCDVPFVADDVLATAKSIRTQLREWCRGL